MGLQKRERAEEYFLKNTSRPATKRFSMQAFDLCYKQKKTRGKFIIKKKSYTKERMAA